MSTDNISIAILEDFVKKVRQATKANQKQLNFSITEAENLSHHLHLILLRLLDKQQNLDARFAAEEQVITVSMDGGGFEEKR
jgi:REP element-mobilizing transposase RayT